MLQLTRALHCRNSRRRLELKVLLTAALVLAFDLAAQEKSVPVPDWAKVSKEQLEYARKAGLPVVKELNLDGKLTLRMALIPPGEFMMGSPNGEKDREVDEGPAHAVKITKPFYMGICEVTQAQYKAVVGKTPAFFKADDNPLENVSWDETVEFCKKLSEKTGLKVTLPTEAEWEYACRAGTKTRLHYGDDPEYSELDKYAWFARNAGGRTRPVGKKLPNAWGLYDMYGNVWERCRDWYEKDYYKESPAEDPDGPAKGTLRVVRGGSCYPVLHDCRSAKRYGVFPALSYCTVGFRIIVQDLK